MEKKVIGYTARGLPIYKCEPGRIYTACFITCGKCNTAISAHGGPSYGATCVNCYSAPKRTDVVHYGMSKKEAQAKYSSTGDFEGPLPICGNGNFHVGITRSKQEVTCEACKKELCYDPQ